MLLWLYRWTDHVRQRARRRRWTPDRALGRDGEDLAHRFLQREGMVIVARNWRTPSGAAEVDLIAVDRETLVFVEVKARETDEYGAPERAIDEVKKDKVVRAAREYVRRTGHDPKRVRFDIVSVVLDPGPVIVHYKDAFAAV